MLQAMLLPTDLRSAGSTWFPASVPSPLLSAWSPEREPLQHCPVLVEIWGLIG